MVSQWLSPGKLNLFLYVTGRQSNGYHYLQTLFQLINYGDSIEFIITNNGKIRLFNVFGNKIVNKNNLIIRAAKLLFNYCGLNKKKFGVDIIINKVLPIGSGLGGGSSNAATTLMVLNQKWKCYLTEHILMNLGLMLGADIPVFISGYSSLSEGFGEKLTPVFISSRWYLIIIPPIKISTKHLFSVYEFFCEYSAYRPIKSLLYIPYTNDFESIVKKIFPEIKIYFKYLTQYTSLVRLTGTGSCIFSEFSSKQLAYQIQGYLPSWMNSIVVQGIYRSPLHESLSKRYI